MSLACSPTQSNTGVVFAKCNTCMLVGRHDGDTQTGVAVNAVGKLRDYLVSNEI